MSLSLGLCNFKIHKLLVLSIFCGSRFVRSQPLVPSAVSVDGPTTMNSKLLELKVQNTLFCKSHLS